MKSNGLHRVFIVLLFAMPVSVSGGQGQQAKTLQPVRKTPSALLASAITRVEPVYNPAALASRVSGTVLVEVTIDEAGSVSSARVLSGPRPLREAALDAARGWTFKPTIQQNQPVRVVGALQFTFRLPDYILKDRLIEQLKRQIANSPKSPQLHYRLGRAYDDNDQSTEALSAYTRAVELNPDYGEALVAIGALRVKLNQFAGALEAYRAAVLLNLAPEVKAAAYGAIGLIYFGRDQFKDSVAPFQQAIKLRPQASLYFKLGEAYIRIGDKSSALEQYRALKGINSIMAQQLLNQINDEQ